MPKIFFCYKGFFELLQDVFRRYCILLESLAFFSFFSPFSSPISRKKVKNDKKERYTRVGGAF